MNRKIYSGLIVAATFYLGFEVRSLTIENHKSIIAIKRVTGTGVIFLK